VASKKENPVNAGNSWRKYNENVHLNDAVLSEGMKGDRVWRGEQPAWGCDKVRGLWCELDLRN
jgi:hypothetical protein